MVWASLVLEAPCPNPCKTFDSNNYSNFASFSQMCSSSAAIKWVRNIASR